MACSPRDFLFCFSFVRPHPLYPIVMRSTPGHAKVVLSPGEEAISFFFFSYLFIFFVSFRIENGGGEYILSQLPSELKSNIGLLIDDARQKKGGRGYCCVFMFLMIFRIYILKPIFGCCCCCVLRWR